MAIKFLEPGGDATFNAALTSAGGFWLLNGSPTVATDFVHGNHMRSLNLAGTKFVAPPDLSVSNSGTRISVYFYLVALPTAKAGIIITSTNIGSGTSKARLYVTPAGVLQLWNGTTAQIGTDGVTLSTGRWYRISLAYTITSTTVNRFELFVDGLSTISITNATLGQTNATTFILGNGGTSDATYDVRFSDIYVDNSSSLTDTGDIWVTAKRPNANGTTNGFTTQIGSGGSGYGIGHSPQVNERALDTTNGWSMIGEGSAITEEYSIEGQSTGDIDSTGGTIIDFVGWVYASSLSSETASIVVGGVSSNISLTSANTMFTKVAGSTTYPAGGTDIGIITTTALTTVSLFECGIIMAFIPAPPADLVDVENPIVQGVKII